MVRGVKARAEKRGGLHPLVYSWPSKERLRWKHRSGYEDRSPLFPDVIGEIIAAGEHGAYPSIISRDSGKLYLLLDSCMFFFLPGVLAYLI